MKKESYKTTKIALIHFLSNPRIKVTYWRVDREVSTLNNNTGWDTNYMTNNGTIEIQFIEQQGK